MPPILPTRSHRNKRLSCAAADSGQASLELALALPLFFLLVLGTAEMANLAWASIQLNNAAHAGAQFASLSHTNAALPLQIEAAVRNEAPRLPITFPTAPAQSCSCVPPTGTATTGACNSILASCASPNIVVDAVQVIAQAVVRPLIHYPGLPASYTLHAQATMQVSNK